MTNIPSSINKIFLGLIIVIIDFNIFIFDLLPDIVGYFIIVSGISQLQPHSSSFSKAKVIGILLALLSLVIVFINPPIALEQFTISNITIYSLLAQSTLGILHLFLVIYVIQGLIEMAKEAKFYPLTNSAKKGLTVYIIGTLATLAASPFIWNVDDSGVFFIITIGALTGFFMEIIILVLLRHFRKRFIAEIKTA